MDIEQTYESLFSSDRRLYIFLICNFYVFRSCRRRVLVPFHSDSSPHVNCFLLLPLGVPFTARSDVGAHPSGAGGERWAALVDVTCGEAGRWRGEGGRASRVGRPARERGLIRHAVRWGCVGEVREGGRRESGCRAVGRRRWEVGGVRIGSVRARSALRGTGLQRDS